MKRFICSIAILVCFSNCDRFREQTNINFDVTYHGGVYVPDFQTSGLMDFPVISVATNSQKLLDDYHAKAKKVVKAHLFMFHIDQIPTTQSFDYIDSVHVYASTSDLPEVLVARKSIIPKNQWRIELVTANSLNMKDYFLRDTIYYRTELYINKMPNPGNKLDLVPTFYVEAKSVL